MRYQLSRDITIFDEKKFSLCKQPLDCDTTVSERFIQCEPALSVVLSQFGRWQELAVLVAWENGQGFTSFEDRLEVFKEATVSLQKDLSVLLKELNAHIQAGCTLHKPALHKPV